MNYLNKRALRRVCQAHENEFQSMYKMQRVAVQQQAPHDFYLFKDNGARVLAVAHLDTVVEHNRRRTTISDTEAGPLVVSGALDDRLGVYVIAELLPRLGVNVDLLFTVGEEWGMSTASFFDTTKEYDWIIEFDRGGTDVVMYQYEDSTTKAMVQSVGARVGKGSFSDIAYLDHLGVKAFNWGVGYQDYHSERGHAWLEDTFEMVDKYVKFHHKFEGTQLPHLGRVEREGPYDHWVGAYSSTDECPHCHSLGCIDEVAQVCEVCETCLDCKTDLRDCMCYTPQSYARGGWGWGK